MANSNVFQNLEDFETHLSSYIFGSKVVTSTFTSDLLSKLCACALSQKVGGAKRYAMNNGKVIPEWLLPLHSGSILREVKGQVLLAQKASRMPTWS